MWGGLARVPELPPFKDRSFAAATHLLGQELLSWHRSRISKPFLLSTIVGFALGVSWTCREPTLHYHLRPIPIRCPPPYSSPFSCLARPFCLQPSSLSTQPPRRPHPLDSSQGSRLVAASRPFPSPAPALCFPAEQFLGCESPCLRISPRPASSLPGSAPPAASPPSFPVAPAPEVPGTHLPGSRAPGSAAPAAPPPAPSREGVRWAGTIVVGAGGRFLSRAGALGVGPTGLGGGEGSGDLSWEQLVFAARSLLRARALRRRPQGCAARWHLGRGPPSSPPAPLAPPLSGFPHV